MDKLEKVNFSSARILELIGPMVNNSQLVRGQFSIVVDKENIFKVCKILKEDSQLDFNQMMDLTAVDFLNHDFPDRFQVVYHLFSTNTHFRVRIKCNVPENDCNVPSVTDLWDAADWYERECYDMYGINFTGHPDMRRLLMYEEFEGHPLRKDYPITKEQPLIPLLDVEERYKYMDKHKYNL